MQDAMVPFEQPLRQLEQKNERLRKQLAVSLHRARPPGSVTCSRSSKGEFTPACSMSWGLTGLNVLRDSGQLRGPLWNNGDQHMTGIVMYVIRKDRACCRCSDENRQRGPT
jgi:hypothetical protein